jgi:hypothetical protein
MASARTCVPETSDCELDGPLYLNGVIVLVFPAQRSSLLHKLPGAPRGGAD